ncbi:MAG: isochorismatase family protein [Chromatiales bacterium]
MTRHEDLVAVPQTSGAVCCGQTTSQLVIVDIQEKLGAAMPEKVLNRVVKNVVVLVQSASLLHIPVAVSEQYPKGLGHTDPRIAGVLPAASRRVEKTCFSCVGAAGFQSVLADASRPQVVVVGMEAHVCVLQTAIDLAAEGLQPFVVEDAVCSRRLENYQNALDRLRQAGVVVTNTESVVFEWLRDARHEQFKALSPLVR